MAGASAGSGGLERGAGEAQKPLDVLHLAEVLSRLTDEQLHWQPGNHPNHMMFAMWHAYRSEDDIIHGLLIQKPGVFAREGWSERLPVAEPGTPPFGTGLSREQIAAVRLRLDDLFDYAEAVRASVQAYADGLSEEKGAELVALPFFAPVYPMLDKMSRAEVLSFFCIGHTLAEQARVPVPELEALTERIADGHALEVVSRQLSVRFYASLGG